MVQRQGRVSQAVCRAILHLLGIFVLIASCVHGGPLCFPCEPGYGVVHECNSTHGTLCAPCTVGHFAARRSFFDACALCTVCQETGLFTAVPCGPRQNALCAKCDDTGSLSTTDLDTTDYHQRCPAKQEPTKPSATDGKKPDGSDRLQGDQPQYTDTTVLDKPDDVHGTPQETFGGEEPNTGNASEPSDGSGLSKEAKLGLIIAAVVAGVIGVILLCVMVLRLSRRRRRKQQATKNGHVYNCSPVAMEDATSRGADKNIALVEMTTNSAVFSAKPKESTPLAAAPNGTVSNGVGHVAHVDDRYLSGIDINPADVTVDKTLRGTPLRLDHTPRTNPHVRNTGSTLQIKFDNDNSVLRDGPLSSHAYHLSHCQFHWGSTDTHGSEHTIEKRQYAGELRLVHWNREYASELEASKSPNGLAVLAVFIEIGDIHETLRLATDKFVSVQFKGESMLLPSSFDASRLLPENRSDYYTYTGSMTETGGPQNVTWVVFKEPIQVSKEQMKAFRQLRNHERDEAHQTTKAGVFLVDNFRTPVTSSTDVSVTSSF